MESPMTYYSFTIKNITNYSIIIESQTIDESYVHFDTLDKGQIINRKILQLQSFTDYKDTLVTTFFKSLKLKALNKNLSLDPLNRKSWNENLDSLSNNNCKSGTCFYTLIIKEEYVK